MNAIKKARKYMETNPEAPATSTFAALILALESEHNFSLARLYELDYDSFLLALELMKEWRLDRYYARKGQVLDIALQVSELRH